MITKKIKPFTQGPWSLEVVRPLHPEHPPGQTNFVLVHEGGQRFQLGHMDAHTLREVLTDHDRRGTAPEFGSAETADCGGTMKIASGLIRVDCKEPPVGASFGMIDVYRTLEELWA